MIAESWTCDRWRVDVAVIASHAGTLDTRAPALPEEVLFRGYLVQTALGRLPLWGVTALSVLVFGVPHLLSMSGARSLAEKVLFLLLPIGFALLATAFRLRTGSVWPAVAVHGGFHVSWWVAGLWVTPRPETYGAYLAVVGGVLLAVGLAAAVWVVTRMPAASKGSAPRESDGSGRP
ncbi:apolipoprotein N-acyltransferase [Catenuloplanes nepalensis]|uniref:Apolipoprotein N-acyltransferase n=1 Tax=Catenuloplanes nepalensis TaxID=587533 RepID=A0ABT9MPW9_9ACTN|nr:CPBP family intramembrane glutamic endopeptidase [Catenuloplanes nepalensis]MDP9793463.1 apolipoprotein N-acyltransferase [Catenuloplanes nepalensis]